MIYNTVKLIILIISGLCSGAFFGAASGTAAPITIPVLSVFLGYSIHQAIGTNLVVDCIIGGVGGFIFLKNKNVNLESMKFLVIPGMLGSFLGSLFTSDTPEFGLGLFIGLILIAMGVDFALKGIKRDVEYIRRRYSFKIFKNHKIVTLVSFGFLIGILGGFSGMGGGGMVAVLLIFLFDYDIHTSIGTSLLMMSFIAASGAIGHTINGEMIYDVVLIVGGMAAFGAIVGSIFANRIDEDKLGRAIGIIILIMGIILLMRQYIL